MDAPRSGVRAVLRESGFTDEEIEKLLDRPGS